MGRLEEALADYSRAIELDPGYRWAIVGRAEIYQQMGRFDEALADLNQVIELDPSNDWQYYVKSLVFFGLSDIPMAMSHLKIAIKLTRKSIQKANQPSNDPYNLAVYLAAAGKFDGAGDQLAEAVTSSPKQLWAEEAIDDLRNLSNVPRDQCRASEQAHMAA